MYVGIIYSHVNKVNKKEYIGQTINSIDSRSGKNGAYYTRNDTVFSSAIKKYGWDNFDHLVLREFKSNDITELKEMLIEEEMNVIASRNTLAPNGYNLQRYDNRIQIHHEESIKKIKKARKKQKISRKTIEAMADANRGKIHSEEHNRRISESKLGHETSQETRDKIAQTVGIYQLGNHWYNNGVKNKRIKEGSEVPDGYVPGYIASNKQKGMMYYNNGIINKRIKEGSEVPEGFMKGQLRKTNDL